VGVQLAPGSHEVRLEYQPGALRKVLLALGLLTLALIPFGEKRGPAFSGWFATEVLAKVSDLIRWPKRDESRQSRRRRRRRWFP